MLVETVASIEAAASAGNVLDAVGVILLNRPKWASWVASYAYRGLTVRTGAGLGATGAGGAAVAGAVPIAWAVYGWVALGYALYEARKIVEHNEHQSGFSHGWVMGILDWQWSHAANRFGRLHEDIYRDSFDPGLGKIRVEAYNRGLVGGYLIGRAAPDDLKKKYIRELRRLAGGVQAGDWGRKAQISFVITLAANARKFGIINYQG